MGLVLGGSFDLVSLPTFPYNPCYKPYNPGFYVDLLSQGIVKVGEENRPYHKGYGILGSMLGSHILGKLPDIGLGQVEGLAQLPSRNANTGPAFLLERALLVLNPKQNLP